MALVRQCDVAGASGKEIIALGPELTGVYDSFDAKTAQRFQNDLAGAYTKPPVMGAGVGLVVGRSGGPCL